LTESDDFNALAAFELRQELGHDHVPTLPAEKDLLDAAPAHAEGGLLFAEDLTFSELTRRFEGELGWSSSRRIAARIARRG
jgi:hypothetical protein